MPNNSLERTQPQRDFMYDVDMLRRSARGVRLHRWISLPHVKSLQSDRIHKG